MNEGMKENFAYFCRFWSKNAWNPIFSTDVVEKTVFRWRQPPKLMPAGVKANVQNIRIFV
jgi:hypothetical protein